MLPRALRLPVSRARRGKKVQTPAFLVYIEPNKAENNRFLFIIGKSVSGLAVRRHRLKRLLTESACKLPPLGADVTVVALPEADKLGSRVLTEEFRRILK